MIDPYRSIIDIHAPHSLSFSLSLSFPKQNESSDDPLSPFVVYYLSKGLSGLLWDLLLHLCLSFKRLGKQRVNPPLQ